MKELKYIKLSNGVEVPRIAFGVGRIQNEMAKDVIQKALSAGFQFIDSATGYGNQEFIGSSVYDFFCSGKDRKCLTLSQKVGSYELGFDNVMNSFNTACKNYETDYIDIMLIYYPTDNRNYKFRYIIDAWRALEKLYKEGKVKVIGVSNFPIDALMMLFAYADVRPMINQIELHPFYQQRMLTKFCQEQNILVEAWSPLMYVVNHNLLKELGEKYHKSSAQIALRWSIQKGFVPVCSSKIENEIKEDLDVFDFEISKEDMEKIDALDGGMHSIDNSIQPQLNAHEIVNLFFTGESYVKKYKLFNVIPILKQRCKRGKVRWYLFGFIPLLKITKKVLKNV